MSAFMSVVGPDAACLLTDGAAYDDQQIVRWVGRKVIVGQTARIAVTTRGDRHVGRSIAKRICDAADLHGVDVAIDAMRNAMPEIARGSAGKKSSLIHVHVVAWSESRGAIHVEWHNVESGLGSRPAFDLYEPPAVHVAGNLVGLQDLSSVRPLMQGEGLKGYMRAVGANIMEAMRRKPGAYLAHERVQGSRYLIGGQVDLTTITADGVKVETLRTWRDRIGETINPFAGQGNVVVLAAGVPAGSDSPPMNRQQRRLADRQRRNAG